MFKMRGSGVGTPRFRHVYFATTLALLLVHSACLTAAAQAGKRPATSDLSPTAKKQATRPRVMEPAFENAGQTAGLEVWRIEDFKPAPYPKGDYGKFYSGDSYIVLSTRINKAGDKLWDIHFWLGSQTSQDESGAAAVLSVQLDDFLGGEPVQHREVQEHESQLFLSYFKNGVRYLPGGIQSGFTHVDPNAFEKRLFQVKGSRNIRVKQVGASIASMNKGDCFILDVGRNIYVYVGVKSKRTERLKAIAAANQIRDQDHAGKAKVHIVDEYGSESDYDEFFEALGSGSKDDVPEEAAGGDDSQFESNQEHVVSLYRVSDASGRLSVDLVGQKPLRQSSLDTNDCFILDTTDSNLFVWVGKKCNNREKAESMTKAQAFLTSKNYPAWTHVERIVEGAEPTAFTQYFQSWIGTGEINRRLLRSVVSNEENDSFEPRLFHAQIAQRGGKFTVEEIFDFEQRDLDEDDVMYLDLGNKIYVWIGSGASVEERTQAEAQANTYLAKLNRDGVDVIAINQNEEPEEFKGIFSSWDPDVWETLTSYSDAKNRVQDANNELD